MIMEFELTEEEESVIEKGGSIMMLFDGYKVVITADNINNTEEQ